MTPNNVVNMSMIKGLDIIAITDHNSIKNIRAAIEVGKKRDIIVIAGMEIQSLEDVHLICLFRSLEDAEKFSELVDKHRLKISNKPEKYGKQLILGEMDELIGEEEYLLITSVNMPIDMIFEEVRALGGFIFPAHIDRKSNSIISNLGFIPDELGINTIELSRAESSFKYLDDDKYSRYKILINSDAHRLDMISERENYLELEELSLEGFFNSLLKKEG